MENDELAEKLYTAYCQAVGGHAYNGDTLPDWKTFRSDPKKRTQSNAWLVVASTAAGHYSKSCPPAP